MAIPPTAPVATIDATGLHLPDFAVVLNYFITGYQSIYGADVYLGNDSQDGQLMSLFATAVDDLNSAIEAAYNSYSPATGQGVGLSQTVKINGIKRDIPTFSTVDLLCVGQVGRPLINCYATDSNGIQWNIPSPSYFGIDGTVTVTATCATQGAIGALAGDIDQIGTPTLGWQSVTNPSTPSIGQPVETDAALRQRQSHSTMIPSETVLDGIIGAVEALPGVVRCHAYENDTDAPVAFNSASVPFPPHSITFLIDGGDDNQIAATIGTKKPPGTYTNGTTAIPWTDPYGIPHMIRFSRPQAYDVGYQIVLNAKTGFTSVIQNNMAQEIADWTNALGPDNDGFAVSVVERVKAFVPAQLYGLKPDSLTYEITDLQIGPAPSGPFSYNDIVLAYDQYPVGEVPWVLVTVNTAPPV